MRARLRGFDEPVDGEGDVASEGAWRGFFMLSDEVLFNPDDSQAPISLLFDSRTWTLIEPIAVARFRGVTAKAPSRESVRVRQ